MSDEIDNDEVLDVFKNWVKPYFSARGYTLQFTSENPHWIFYRIKNDRTGKTSHITEMRKKELWEVPPREVAEDIWFATRDIRNRLKSGYYKDGGITSDAENYRDLYGDEITDLAIERDKEIRTRRNSSNAIAVVKTGMGETLEIPVTKVNVWIDNNSLHSVTPNSLKHLIEDANISGKMSVYITGDRKGQIDAFEDTTLFTAGQDTVRELKVNGETVWHAFDKFKDGGTITSSTKEVEQSLTDLFYAIRDKEDDRVPAIFDRLDSQMVKFRLQNNIISLAKEARIQNLNADDVHRLVRSQMNEFSYRRTDGSKLEKGGTTESSAEMQMRNAKGKTQQERIDLMIDHLKSMNFRSASEITPESGMAKTYAKIYDIEPERAAALINKYGTKQFKDGGTTGSDIATLKAAIASPATPKQFIPQLKAKLAELEGKSAPEPKQDIKTAEGYLSEANKWASELSYSTSLSKGMTSDEIDAKQAHYYRKFEAALKSEKPKYVGVQFKADTDVNQSNITSLLKSTRRFLKGSELKGRKIGETAVVYRILDDNGNILTVPKADVDSFEYNVKPKSTEEKPFEPELLSESTKGLKVGDRVKKTGILSDDWKRDYATPFGNITKIERLKNGSILIWVMLDSGMEANLLEENWQPSKSKKKNLKKKPESKKDRRGSAPATGNNIFKRAAALAKKRGISHREAIAELKGTKKTTTKVKRKKASSIIAKDAYSFEKYGEKTWNEITKFLITIYSEKATELILRAKHMRYAADRAESEDSKPTLSLFKKFYTDNKHRFDATVKDEIGEEGFRKKSESKPKVVKRSKTQTGDKQTKRGVKADKGRKALPAGKRISKTGKSYTETRKNRSDLDGRKKV